MKSHLLLWGTLILMSTYKSIVKAPPNSRGKKHCKINVLLYAMIKARKIFYQWSDISQSTYHTRGDLENESSCLHSQLWHCDVNKPDLTRRKNTSETGRNTMNLEIATFSLPRIPYKMFRAMLKCIKLMHSELAKEESFIISL